MKQLKGWPFDPVTSDVGVEGKDSGPGPCPKPG
jgi:hypothetical protein